MRQSQEVLRPDRLVFGPDHRVWVLDYKTGMPKPEHTQQVTRYARALGHMGYTLEEALIIYVQPGSIDVVSVHNTPTDEHDI
jgi:predicted Ser/Thr protein kinase